MKKAISAILAAAAAAAFGETSTDVLAWYVDTSASYAEGRNIEFDEIKFWAVSDSDGSQVQLGTTTWNDRGDVGDASAYVGSSSLGSGYIGAGGPSATASENFYTSLAGLGGDASGYSFWMELFNGGSSEAVSYKEGSPIPFSALQSYVYSLSDLASVDLDPTSVGHYNFGQVLVPEPTSGLLMLVGGALLALRRRRV